MSNPEKHTWIQVRFSLPLKMQSMLNGGQAAGRFFNQHEADKFVQALPELGCEYLGCDILVADTADTVIGHLKAQFNLSEGTVLPLKLVADNTNG